MLYVVGRNKEKTHVQKSKKASLYDVRSGACSTWYVIEKLEKQQREHATHAWRHILTGAARRLDALLLLLLLLVVEAVVVLCLAARRLHVGHSTAGGASRTSIGIYAKAAAFFCHMYVGLHAPGWL